MFTNLSKLLLSNQHLASSCQTNHWRLIGFGSRRQLTVGCSRFQAKSSNNNDQPPPGATKKPRGFFAGLTGDANTTGPRDLFKANSSYERSSSSKMNTRKSRAGDKLNPRPQPTEVKHDKQNCRFTLDLGNNQVARIEYKTRGPNSIELYHTEVPQELRGRGIGKELARGALEQAANAKTKVKLTCEYLIHYVNRHADSKYKKIVEK